MLTHPVLREVARRHGTAPAQVALAWVLRTGHVCAVPTATTTDAVRRHRAAVDLALSPDDLADLDLAFPPPGVTRGAAERGREGPPALGPGAGGRSVV